VKAWRSFKGPFSFKDRGAIELPLPGRIARLNELFEIAVQEQERILVEMIQLMAESRKLKAPVVLRRKLGGGGVQPAFQLAAPRSEREWVIKLLWIGRSAAKQVKTPEEQLAKDIGIWTAIVKGITDSHYESKQSEHQLQLMLGGQAMVKQEVE
jgi:hypothetical protein